MSCFEAIANTGRALVCVDACSHDVIYASVILAFGSRRRIPWLSLQPLRPGCALKEEETRPDAVALTK